MTITFYVVDTVSRLLARVNDRSFSRWLKRLIQEGVLKKSMDGYALELHPKEYRVFDYLNELRKKYSNYIYEGEIRARAKLARY